MPKGLSIITSVNAVLCVLCAAYLLYNYYSGTEVQPYNVVCAGVAVIGLLANLFAIMMRTPMWHRVARGSIYAMMLAFGMQILGMLPELLDWWSTS